MRININYHIASIRQPEPNDCWATAAAMIMRRHSVRGVTHVKNLCRQAGVQLKNDGSLPPQSVQRFAGAIRKRCIALSGRSMSLNYLKYKLTNGPVMILGKVKNHTSTGQSEIKHALAINGLRGNNTESGTYVYFSDPATGYSIYLYYDYFIQQVIDRVDYVVF